MNMNIRSRLTALMGMNAGEVRRRPAMRRQVAAVAALSVALFAQPQLGHAATDVFAVFADNGPVDGVVASLFVPAGAYAINAKVNLDNDDQFLRNVVCNLGAGGDFDENAVRLEADGGSNVDQAVVAHQLVHISPNGTNISLFCSAGFNPERVRAKFAKITAIRIDGALSNVPQ